MPPPHALPLSRRAVVALAWIVAALVVHGSLYPWRFALPPSLAQAWHQMVHQPSLWTSRGDVVGNVALFLPVGALGWALARRLGPLPRAGVVLVLGTLFAFVLQLAQLFVPQRDAALSDVLWNALGIALGIAAASGAAWLPRVGFGGAGLRLPLTMAALWLLLQWWPLVPHLDWQQLKDALKPLLLTPQWSTFSAIEAALSVMVVGTLARGLPARGLLLLALVALAALGKLFITGQVLTPGRVAGWALGLIGAWGSWRLPPRAAAWCMALAAWAWFTVDELRPFQLADTLGTFHWLPFAALLQGSLAANTLALAWHLFWLGAVMLLAGTHGARAAPLALVLGAWALLMELLQLLLPGRVADVTPLLLPWLWLLALPLLQPRTGARRA